MPGPFFAALETKPVVAPGLEWLGRLTTADGAPADAASLSGKCVALYFSAHWCPPCRKFTPILKDVYAEVNEDARQFEVVFVSSDESAEAQRDYMAAMHGPWLTIRHDDLQREALKRRFGCYGAKEQPKWPDVTRRAGIPSLVVVAPDGAELVFEARDQLEKLGPAAVAKWPTWS